MSHNVFVLNGPNLDLLGKRQPEVYGRDTLADVEALCRKSAAAHGLTIEFRQSNREYELIDWIHEARERAAAIVINPAGYSHTSVAILDALAAYSTARSSRCTSPTSTSVRRSAAIPTFRPSRPE